MKNLNEEFDLCQVMIAVDNALMSNDPRLIEALKKFLFVASLIDPDTIEDRHGPLEYLRDECEYLRNRIAILESQTQQPSWEQKTGPPAPWTITTSGGTAGEIKDWYQCTMPAIDSTHYGSYTAPPMEELIKYIPDALDYLDK